MQVIKFPFFHIVFIFMCAVGFNLLPFFVSGIPLQHQLLSDVESHIATWQIALNPKAFANDRILQLGIKTLPTGQTLSSHLFILIAKYFNIDIYLWSVLLSLCTLILFLCGLYLLVLYSLKDKLSAFLIAFFSIIPIHALGGATFGFRALGFLPRDLVLALIMFVLLLYFRGIQQKNTKYIAAAFFVFGILTNFYPSFLANIVMVLLFAEFIRTRRIDIIYFWYVALFLLGALPSVIDFIIKSNKLAPIDINIMRSYYGYMTAHPFSRTGIHYLRRFASYAFSNVVIYFLIFRKAHESDKRILRPFYAIAASSFILSVLGVYIECTTVFVKYVLSRASLWFTLASMAITAFGARLFFKKYFTKSANVLIVIAVSVVFLGQSNIVTYCRFLKSAHKNRVQIKEFHIAISALKEMTEEGDIILAPTEEFYDLAASVRTYSYRPIYVCYKYGGSSIMDGDIAREWLDRYKKVAKIFKDFNSEKLINFMKQEKIQYAFMPINYYSENDQFLKDFIVVNTGYYLIIKV